MKTPREILLEEHREAEPELDAIRRRVVAGASRLASERPPASSASWVGLLWNQLFVPSRPAWFSLAAAWLVVLTLSLSRPQAGAVGNEPASARQTFLSLKPLLEEQAQLRAELLRSGSSLSPTDPEVRKPNYPGTRSDRRRGSSEDGSAGGRGIQAQAPPAGLDGPPVA